jgi:gliding motility-associated-like protein
MKTIYLTDEQLSINENELSWNAFKGFDGDVSKYYIFRILSDGIMPTIHFDSVIASSPTYSIIDDVSSFDENEIIFSYWVQAIERDSNSFGYKEKSNSNIISFRKETTFYFPNAFRPNSTLLTFSLTEQVGRYPNKTFKPVTTGYGGSTYLLQIYNRWGQLIFESSEYDEGWDGTYNGNPSPQGTYVYKLVYDNVFGVSKQQKGSVTLID